MSGYGTPDSNFRTAYRLHPNCDAKGALPIDLLTGRKTVWAKYLGVLGIVQELLNRDNPF